MAYVQLSRQGWCVIVILVVVFFLYYFSGREKINGMQGKVVNLRDLAERSIMLAKDAGNLIRTRYRAGHLNSRLKSASMGGPQNEMLTDVDLQSHRLLVSGLTESFPGLKVLSEEHPPSNAKASASKVVDTQLDIESELPDDHFYIPISDLTVWIDPLDATQEFTEGLLDYVTVMICVASHGYPVIGVVHQPFLNRTYWSWSSRAISKDLKRAVLESKINNMSNNDHVPDKVHPLVITHSRSHLDTLYISKIFGTQPVRLIPAGGSGYKVLSLIQGRAHLYVHPSSIRRWDICAAQAILEATGGRLTGLDGTRLTYHASDPERVSENTGLFAAASISEHNRWLPVVAEFLKEK